ncbi:pentapeptide repeat protein [Leptolyngbya sp. NIES-3755]|nr:pentapeptide repeat protein [Leptolyngbya sp. NIES-3755]
MSEQTDPKPTDLVRGGAVPPPIDAVVLGGIDGLKARFGQAEIEQKRSILSAALQYGEEGLGLLWRGLEDDSLKVRSHSYFLLKSTGVKAPELEMGIPLRVGDRIYAAYQSAVAYGDDWYYIYNFLYYEEDAEWFRENSSFYHSCITSGGGQFEYVSDAPEDNLEDVSDEPHLIGFFIEQARAEQAAETAYRDKFKHLDCQIYDIDHSRQHEFDLKNWVDINQITVDVNFPDEREGWGNSNWQYNCCVLMSLQKQQQFDLLQELWEQLGYSPLGFVHEYVIDRNCYLRLSNYETAT